MGTPFSEIIDRALITINDYKLDAVYTDDPELFEDILCGYLIKGIPNFSQCLKPLDYDEASKSFVANLDIYEQNILADYTVITWYESQLQDVLEFQEALQDKEFKRYSTGQNLTPRQNYLTDLKSRVHQEGCNYQLMHLDEFPFFGGGE